MSGFSKVFPSGLVDGVDSLTAAEMVALDDDHVKAPNFDDGDTKSPAAKVTVGGAGMELLKLLLGARTPAVTPYALDAAGADVALLVDTTIDPAGVEIDLPAAVANRTVYVKAQTGTNGVRIKPNGTETIEGLNANYALTQLGSSVMLVGLPAGGGWAILSRGRNLTSKTFTATTSSGWTAPAGCRYVDLDMWGGGAGGSSGTSGSTATNNAAGGGPGGGAAKRKRVRVPVTPGQAYDINIGSGGTGGSGGSAGTVGGSTSFQTHGGSILETALGGGAGTPPAALSSGGTIAPGGTDNGAALSQGGSWGDTVMLAVAGQGGFGGNGLSGAASSAGSPSADGKSGGAVGSVGGNAGSYDGGGAGAGGGAGPGGTGGAGGNGGAANGAGAGTAGTAGSNPAGVATTAAATTNTGAGGGGGGAGGCGSASGGAGAAGGGGDNGKLTIYWFE